VSAASLIVMAKSPVPGRVKTRLCPPCTPGQAAALARAALADTLAVALTTPVARRVVALDGEVGAWLARGVEVVTQRGPDLAARLGDAFDQVGGPALLIGMDTPQVTSALLQHALDALDAPGVDAVLGPAVDGGWWLIGLRRADPRVFTGIATSRPTTGSRQWQRLATLGLRVRSMPVLRDVDSYADAREVAATIGGSRFATALATVERTLQPHCLAG
jgi:rSAM/selenodomain-associated transferase 1